MTGSETKTSSQLVPHIRLEEDACILQTVRGSRDEGLKPSTLLTDIFRPATDTKIRSCGQMSAKAVYRICFANKCHFQLIGQFCADRYFQAVSIVSEE